MYVCSYLLFCTPFSCFPLLDHPVFLPRIFLLFDKLSPLLISEAPHISIIHLPFYHFSFQSQSLFPFGHPTQRGEQNSFLSDKPQAKQGAGVVMQIL